MCGFHPQPPWDRKWHFFCVFWQKFAFFIRRQSFLGLQQDIEIEIQPDHSPVTTCWPFGGTIMTGSGVKPPFLWPLFDLCTKMPTTWGLMTHSKLYKDKTLDNRSPARSLAHTGSYPHDRKLSNVTGNGPKIYVKLLFFTIWRPFRWTFSISKLAY